MNTKEQLLLIAKIGIHDLDILAGRERLKRLNQDSYSAKSNAAKLEESISLLQAKKQDFLQRKKQLDENLHNEKSNLRKWESRAEKIRGEREYTALMSEISSQKRSIIGIEGEISEVNQELKKCDEQILMASGSHQENISLASQSLVDVKDLLAQEEKSLEKSEALKQELVALLPIPLKLRYERIYKNRLDQGITFLANEVCQVCQRKVPAEIFIKVCQYEVIEQCPSCQRIMVWENAKAEGEQD